MTPNDSIADFMAVKTRQEANRARRLQELYSPAQLWAQQQQALAELEKLGSGAMNPRAERRAGSSHKSPSNA